jgi:tetratricopeptide (TPR) repeat protein
MAKSETRNLSKTSQRIWLFSLALIVATASAIGLRPDYANAQNNPANALRQTGRIEEAVHEYEAALKSEPGPILAQNNLAWLLATSSNASVPRCR